MFRVPRHQYCRGATNNYQEQKQAVSDFANGLFCAVPSRSVATWIQSYLYR